MHTRRSQLAFALACTWLVACATGGLTTTRDPEFEGPMRKIAIVVYCPKRPADERALREGLSEQLSAHGLTTITGKTLDATFKRRIARFEPDGLLVVTAAPNSQGPGRFDISIYPHGQARKRIWQTTVEPDAAGAPPLSQLPAAVTEQLITDRIL